MPTATGASVHDDLVYLGPGTRGLDMSCLRPAGETSARGAPRLPLSPDAPRVCHGQGVLWGPV